MKLRIAALAASGCLVASAAAGQGFEKRFEASVPTLGPVKTRVGVAPAALVNCEVQKPFADGAKLATPMITYVIVERTGTQAVTYEIELTANIADGPQIGRLMRGRFDAGALKACYSHAFESGNPPAKLEWKFNDMTVGTLAF